MRDAQEMLDESSRPPRRESADYDPAVLVRAASYLLSQTASMRAKRSLKHGEDVAWFGRNRIDRADLRDAIQAGYKGHDRDMADDQAWWISTVSPFWAESIGSLLVTTSHQVRQIFDDMRIQGAPTRRAVIVAKSRVNGFEEAFDLAHRALGGKPTDFSPPARLPRSQVSEGEHGPTDDQIASLIATGKVVPRQKIAKPVSAQRIFGHSLLDRAEPGEGPATCECGVTSEAVFSSAKGRQRWHALHKAEVARDSQSVSN